FFIQLYPNGVDESSKDFVSLFLLNATSHGQQFNAQLRVSILDKHGKTWKQFSMYFIYLFYIYLFFHYFLLIYTFEKVFEAAMVESFNLNSLNKILFFTDSNHCHFNKL